MGVPKKMVHQLQRALNAVQHELRLLEQDFGLCADCGDGPPPPLKPRRLHAAPIRVAVPIERRRVA